MKAKTEKTIEREKEMRERFQRIAPKRTQKVLDAIDLLWQCSSRDLYIYTDAEARSIVKAIRDRADVLETAFEKVDRPAKKKFTL